MDQDDIALHYGSRPANGLRWIEYFSRGPFYS